ncbi:MAG: helix-turn-helix domain-containing protein [Chloroflexota bacterium]
MSNITPNVPRFPQNYCEETVSELASRIAAGESCTLIGLPGMGQGTLLSYLCSQENVLEAYLGDASHAIFLIEVDLNHLPNGRLVTFYQLILRSLYTARKRFGKKLGRQIKKVYEENGRSRDVFWVQSSLQALLLKVKEHALRIVLVFKHFDHFCKITTSQMGYTLHGLRDSFKGTLSFLVGLRQEVRFLADSDKLGPFYGPLDANTCWVRPLNKHDAQEMIIRLTDKSIGETEIDHMLTLTAGCPGLLRVVCRWWLDEFNQLQSQENANQTNSSVIDRFPLDKWEPTLMQRTSTAYRLEKIWASLTQEEQFVLRELYQLQSIKNKKKREKSLSALNSTTLKGLLQKGLCHFNNNDWAIAGRLLQNFLADVVGQGRGRIWKNAKTGEIFQGDKLIKLPPLETSILSYLIQSPYQRHTHTDLIEVAWSEDAIYREGKPTEALYQVVRGIRKAIEPEDGKPVYLQTWRGRPEGGYQFFPEGRPDIAKEGN